jgi:chromosome partitioning protein
VFRRFKALNPEMGFATNMGVLVNMKDMHSPTEDDYHTWLKENPDNKCFDNVVPRAVAIQEAARFHVPDRSYYAKYPGATGQALRALSEEILARLAAAQTEGPVTAPAEGSGPASSGEAAPSATTTAA